MKILGVLLGSLLFSSTALAQDKEIGRMLPLPEELLDHPISLTQECSKVQIEEWKPTPGATCETSESIQVINKLDQICNQAFKSVKKFWKIKAPSLTTYSTVTVQAEISFLPAVGSISKEYRNLNDVTYRFNKRSAEYDDKGRPYPIWGYSQSSMHHIYSRNDFLQSDCKTFNKQAIIVFAHEIYHALSYQLSIYHQMSNDKEEEKFAYSFTEYLGLGK